MNNTDLIYKNLLSKIIKEGDYQLDRTRTGTTSIFGEKIEFNMLESFPIISTKNVWFTGILHELLWFISGSSNIKYLVENKVNIWNAWAYKRYSILRKYYKKELSEKEFNDILKNESKYYTKDYKFLTSNLSEFRKKTYEDNLSEKDFINNIIINDEFAEAWGNLGPVYGSQWRNWNCEGIDQLQNAIDDLKTNPDSRRIMVSAYNVGKLNIMALDPCHFHFQFHSRKDKTGNRRLSLSWNQRSVDVFLGLPFNITSYAILLKMVAHLTNHTADKLIGFLGNTHIYTNHIDQVNTQIKRKVSTDTVYLKILRDVIDIDDFKFDDFKLIGYNPQSKIKAPIAV